MTEIWKNPKKNFVNIAPIELKIELNKESRDPFLGLKKISLRFSYGIGSLFFLSETVFFHVFAAFQGRNDCNLKSRF